MNFNYDSTNLIDPQLGLLLAQSQREFLAHILVLRYTHAIFAFIEKSGEFFLFKLLSFWIGIIAPFSRQQRSRPSTYELLM